MSLIRLNVGDVYGGVIAGRDGQDAALATLAASIARHGLLQPILVRRNEQAGRYALISGARRLAACRMLGMKQIDALALNVDEQEAAACMMEEHLCAVRPHFLDEAQAIERAGSERVLACFALTPSLIVRRLRMLRLGEALRRQIKDDNLSLEQAEPLLMIAREDRQMEAASIIAQRDLTPAQARRLVCGKRMAASPVSRRRAVRQAVQEMERLAKELAACGMDASVATQARSGGIAVELLIKTRENGALRQE